MNVLTPYKAIIATDVELKEILWCLAFHLGYYETKGGLVVEYPNETSCRLDMKYLCNHIKDLNEEDIEIQRMNLNELF